MRFDALSLAAVYDVTCSLQIDDIHQTLDCAFNADGDAPLNTLTGVHTTYLGIGDTLRIDRESYSPRSVESSILSGVGTFRRENHLTRIQIEYYYDIGMVATVFRILFYLGLVLLAVLSLNAIFTDVPLSERLTGLIIATIITAIPLIMFRLFRFEISTFHQFLVNTLRNS